MSVIYVVCQWKIKQKIWNVSVFISRPRECFLVGDIFLTVASCWFPACSAWSNKSPMSWNIHVLWEQLDCLGSNSVTPFRTSPILSTLEKCSVGIFCMLPLPVIISRLLFLTQNLIHKLNSILTLLDSSVYTGPWDENGPCACQSFWPTVSRVGENWIPHGNNDQAQSLLCPGNSDILKPENWALLPSS